MDFSVRMEGWSYRLEGLEEEAYGSRGGGATVHGNTRFWLEEYGLGTGQTVGRLGWARGKRLLESRMHGTGELGLWAHISVGR
jgi:hypothetical protein